jgi:(2Fe-2S) ferredoxin
MYYDPHIFCCTNKREEGKRESCGRKGAEDLYAYLKARLKDLSLPQRARVNQSGCLNRCEEGPCLVIYPQGVWYRCRTKAEIDAMIERHFVHHERAEELML